MANETEMWKCYICAQERIAPSQARMHEVTKHHGDATMYPLSELPEWVRIRTPSK